MNCPACTEHRTHTAEDWTHHPYKGHGYAPECGGWTHPELTEAAQRARELEQSVEAQRKAAAR